MRPKSIFATATMLLVVLGAQVAVMAVFSVSAGAATLTSATATDRVSVQVLYSAAMDPATATSVANYAIGGVTISSASISADARTVTLVIPTASPMVGGQTYSLVVSNVQDAQGNLIVPNTLVRFTVPGAPYVSSVTSTDLVHVSMTFSGPVDTASATTATNYTLSGGIAVQSASVTGNTVTLTVSQMASNAPYVLTINGVLDKVVPADTISTTVPFTSPLGPIILSATATNLTSVILVFSKPVVTATSSANYSVSATSGGISVTAVQFTSTTTCILTVSPMTVGTTYTVTALNMTDTLVPPITTASSTKTFVSPTGPTVASVTVVDSTHLTVTFTKTVTSATATATGNYVIGGLAISAATTASGSSVTLTVAPMAAGTSYMLTASGIQDTIPITTPTSTKGFTTPAAPTLTSVTVVDRTHLTVTFSKAVTTASATNVANYGIGGGVTVTASSTASTSSVTLTVTSLVIGPNTLSVANIVDTTGFMISPNPSTTSVQYALVLVQYTFPTVVAAGNQSSTTYYPTLIGTGVATSATATPGLQLATGTGLLGLAVVANAGYANPASSPLAQFGTTAQTGTMTDATTSNQYMTFTVAPVSGQRLNLTSLDFDMARGGVNNRGYGVYTSVDGFDATGTTAKLIQTGTVTSGRGAWQHFSLPLTAAKFQGLTAITIRIYFYVDTASLTALDFDNLTLYGGAVAPNTPPTVAVTSPAGGLISGQGTPITLVATATDTDGSVASVHFFDGATGLGSGVLAGGVWTYGWDTTTATIAIHNLTAVATDNLGLATTSSPPTGVTIRLPADGNGDNIVDGEDYGIWQNGYNHAGPTMLTGDYNGDGIVDGEDYGVWQNNYNRIIGLGDVVAASPADGVSTPMSGAAAPRLIAMTPASGDVVTGVASLTLVFDSAVQASAGAVEVSGLATGSHSDYGTAYDAATRTLKITWPAPLPADRYTVRIVADFVTAADSGLPLDGEVGSPAGATLPSGDGVPGGDAVLVFEAR